MVFDFSLEPVSRTDLPSKSVVVEKAKSLISNIPNWTKGKSFQYTLKEGDTTEVQTYHTSYNNEPWFARVSKHKLPFQLFKDGIFFNHTSNEQHYIELLKEVHEITATDLGIKGDETIDWNGMSIKHILKIFKSSKTDDLFNNSLCRSIQFPIPFTRSAYEYMDNGRWT